MNGQGLAICERENERQSHQLPWYGEGSIQDALQLDKRNHTSLN